MSSTIQTICSCIEIGNQPSPAIEIIPRNSFSSGDILVPTQCRHHLLIQILSFQLNSYITHAKINCTLFLVIVNLMNPHSNAMGQSDCVDCCWPLSCILNRMERKTNGKIFGICTWSGLMILPLLFDCIWLPVRKRSDEK